MDKAHNNIKLNKDLYQFCKISIDKIVKNKYSGIKDKEVLISAGWFAVVNCIKNYDERKSNNIKAYILISIKRSISKAVRKLLYWTDKEKVLYLEDKTADHSSLLADLKTYIPEQEMEKYFDYHTALKVIKDLYNKKVLTEIESRIIIYVLNGLTLEEIAKGMNRSIRTTKYHWLNARKKINGSDNERRI